MKIKGGLIIAVSALIVSVLLAAGALAGPLDRSSTGPRRNPAADDMIRVPGVVGMHYKRAMSALQQAGLSPQVKRIRTVEGRYDGHVGEVVRQVPGAGGVAMLGSSVSITYYLPEGMEAPEPDGYGDGGEGEGGYEDGDGYEEEEWDEGAGGSGEDEYTDEEGYYEEDGEEGAGEGVTGPEEYYDEDEEGGPRKPAWGKPIKGIWKPKARDQRDE